MITTMGICDTNILRSFDAFFALENHMRQKISILFTPPVGYVMKTIRLKIIRVTSLGFTAGEYIEIHHSWSKGE